MGYSECCCQICGVSINVARLRTKNEPMEAGWGYSGSLYYMGNDGDSRCSIMKEKTGCEDVHNTEAGNDYLHFPGRGCSYQGAYSGLRIGADEMKGMNLPRYIILKPTNKNTELERQEDYELKSDFFVTSQTTCPPNDFEPGELAQVRFGIDNFYPQNYSVVEWDDQEWGVPVHAACWKIFERVSKQRLGEVDLQGFMALWARQACGICGFQNLKQDPMIVKCREQFWEHIPGTEYLAANPHDIPGFPEILLEQYCAEYPLGDGAFTLWNDSCSSDFSKPGNLGDPFTGLPTELKNMIVSHLSSKDIASLRLTSRSFRQISRTVFRRLIREELPWFWEYDTLEEYRLECLQYENGLSQEAAATKHTQMTVNWLEIYTRLCIAKRTILGVQNRARVWDLTEEVVRRVAQLRKTREGVGFSFEHGEDLRVRPSEEEQEAGVVKNYIYCPRCRPAGT